MSNIEHQDKAVFSKFKFFCSQHYFLILTLVLSVSYFCFGTYRNWPYKIESDGKYYYQYLVSGILDKDFDFTNNYRVKRYEWMVTEIDHYNFRKDVNPITKRPTNLFTVGPAILWAPFFIIATIMGKLLTAFNFSVDLNPYGLYYQYSVMYSGVIYCIGGLFLLHHLLTRYVSDLISKVTIWIILISTPLYYYTIFEVSMSHVYDFFMFTLFFYLITNLSKSSHFLYYVVLGGVGALHALIRTQNITTVFLFSLYLVFQHWQTLASTERGSWGKIGIYVIVLVIGLSPIALVNYYLYGHPFTIPQGSNFLAWSNPQILSLLFSQRNGLFSHHPILFLGLLGYIWVLVHSFRYKQDFLLFLTLFISVLLQIYINSTVLDWWAGHSYGQRRLTFSLPLFGFGISYLLKESVSFFNSKRVFHIFLMVIICITTIINFYLIFIHVFIWDYDKPHNIIKWMLYYAPIRLFEKLLELYW